MNSDSLEQTTCSLIESFTFYQYILQQIGFFPWAVKPGADYKDMQSDQKIHFYQYILQQPSFFPWTVKAQSRLQGHAVWSKDLLFTSTSYNSQDSFHEQWRPGADYKVMQADQDLHFSQVDSTTAKGSFHQQLRPVADNKDM